MVSELRTQRAGGVRARHLGVVAVAIMSIVTTTVSARASQGFRPPDAGEVAGDAGEVASTLVALEPCRLLDTRITDDASISATDIVLRLPVHGRCGVVDDANAAALNLTVTEPTEEGFLTAYPAGLERPLASNLNWQPHETRANGAIVRLSGGAIDLHISSPAEVVVDVTAAFVPTDEAAEGRFVAIDPIRVTDTRSLGARPARGGDISVPLPDSIPPDAVAVAASLTTTDSTDAGYFSVRAEGMPAPLASALNTDGPRQTRAAGTIVPVNEDGFEVRASHGGQVIVDVTGYFTGPSAPTLPATSPPTQLGPSYRRPRRSTPPPSQKRRRPSPSCRRAPRASL